MEATEAENFVRSRSLSRFGIFRYGRVLVRQVVSERSELTWRADGRGRTCRRKSSKAILLDETGLNAAVDDEEDDEVHGSGVDGGASAGASLEMEAMTDARPLGSDSAGAVSPALH